MKKFLLINIVCIFSAFSAMMSGTVPATDTHYSISQQHGPTMKSVENGIEFTVADGTETKFYIFSITGQMVKSLSVASGTTAVAELPVGCYIVKCEYWSKKILVR